MQEKASTGDDLCRTVAEKMVVKDDSFLLRFIRARKFEVNRSYDLLKGKMIVSCARLFEQY